VADRVGHRERAEDPDPHRFRRRVHADIVTPAAKRDLSRFVDIQLQRLRPLPQAAHFRHTCGKTIITLL
jgi:hypothetical protein